MKQGEIDKINIYFLEEIMTIDFRNNDFGIADPVGFGYNQIKETIKIGTCLVSMTKNKILEVKFNLNNFIQEFRDFMQWLKLLEQKQNCQEDKIYYQILYNVIDQNKECLFTPPQ